VTANRGGAKSRGEKFEKSARTGVDISPSRRTMGPSLSFTELRDFFRRVCTGDWIAETILVRRVNNQGAKVVR
jgi:hypothetical protein